MKEHIEQIDKLQEKCFAMIGTINIIRHEEHNEIPDQALIARFNKDLTSLMETGSAFFSAPQPPQPPQ